MDIRHPFKDSDKILINWSKKTKTPLLVILNKADKLSKNQSRIELEKSKKLMKEISVDFEIIAFSSKDLNGLNELRKSLERLLLL